MSCPCNKKQHKEKTVASCACKKQHKEETVPNCPIVVGSRADPATNTCVCIDVNDAKNKCKRKNHCHKKMETSDDQKYYSVDLVFDSNDKAPRCCKEDDISIDINLESGDKHKRKSHKKRCDKKIEVEVDDEEDDISIDIDLDSGDKHKRKSHKKRCDKEVDDDEDDISIDIDIDIDSDLDDNQCKKCPKDYVEASYRSAKNCK